MWVNSFYTYCLKIVYTAHGLYTTRNGVTDASRWHFPYKLPLRSGRLLNVNRDSVFDSSAPNVDYSFFLMPGCFSIHIRAR